VTRSSRFADRAAAGRELAAAVAAVLVAPTGAVWVLGLARGGVPVAAPVAAALGARLDVLTVRKIGAPRQPELALGAVTSGGGIVLNHALVEQLGIDDARLERQIELARAELRQREARLRDGRPDPVVADATVVLVDDGLATGATMRAAVAAMRAAGAATVVAAVPVGAPDSCAAVAAVADLVVCPRQPSFFRAVGEWYDDFTATTDDDVRRLLLLAAPPPEC